MTCSVRAAALARPEGVSVNGVLIPRDAIALEVQHHPAPSAVAAWKSAARALVVRELLLQEAARLGLVAEPLSDGEGRRETHEDALIRALVEREVATPQPDAATCRRYFEANRGRFPAEAPFETVAERIADYLTTSVRRRAAAQYVARLARKADIDGLDLDADMHRVH